VFAPADHFALATKDQYAPAAEFLGNARVDRDPAHVTYVVNPTMDFPEAGTVADHAYWLSGLRVRDASGEAPRALVDAVSEGFGAADPEPGPTESGGGALTGGGAFPPAMAYAEQRKAWAEGGSAPVADRLRITATNLSEVTVNVQRARVTCGVDLEVDSDGPLTVRLDGCGRVEEFGRPGSCRAANGFVRAAARPRGRRVAIEAAQIQPGRFRVDIFRQSRGRRTVRRFPASQRAPGRSHRLRLSARGLRRGTYRVVVRVEPSNGVPVRAVLASRKL